MKKRILSVVLAAVMLLSLTGCHDKKDLALIEELQGANAQLSAEVESLKAEVASLRSMSLQSWDITAQPSEDGTLADVTFTAVPDGLLEGQTVNLEVMLDGQVVGSVSGTFDGSTFTANTQLEPKDGYSFYCVLSDGSTSFKREALMDPANASLATLMKLGQAMNAYCTLVVDDWKVEDGKLNLKLNLSAKLPEFVSKDSPANVESAKLCFAMGEQEPETKDVTFEVGENGMLEAVMDGLSLTIPEKMEKDAQLTLTLNVKLTNGQELKSAGAAWFMQDDALVMVTG